MAVIYLQPEDEITGAVARLRAVAGTDVVLVVPASSRLATSRINFRLLGREAQQRELRLAIVSDEPPVRALATAAGITAHATVDAAETALAQAGAVGAAIGGDAATPVPDEKTDFVPIVAPAATPPAVRPPRAGGRLSVEPPLYGQGADGPRRRRRPATLAAPAIVLGLLIVLVGLALYGAYLLVPTATVTLTPKLVDVGPLSMSVTADPRVAVVDNNAGLIPATQIQVPVEASNTFSATGTQVTQTAASGSVRFSSKNTVFQVPVPAGTVVSTANGIEFETTDSVTVPRANFDTHKAGTADVNVVARDKGTRGNVDANAIKKLPDSLASALVSVRNPAPTSGGSRTELPVITQSDYDGALAALTAELPAALATALADSALTPHGLTLYRETAVLGAATADQAAAALVDLQQDNFALAVTAPATVLAVNEDLVDQVALAQLNTLVPSGTTLLPQTITTTHAPGLVRGQAVVFNASGVAKSWRSPNANELVAQISGQSVTEARTIMETYGTVEITIWPDFVDHLPDQNRIRLVIVPPQETL